jgi:hypothetical protein
LTNVAHQIGGSLGLAVLVAVFAGADSDTLHGGALLAHRISAALLAGSVVLVLALLIALVVRPRRPRRAEAWTPAGALAATTGTAAPEASQRAMAAR